MRNCLIFRGTALSAAALLVALSCTKEVVIPSEPDIEQGSSVITLVSRDPSMTRISVADKNAAGYYKFNWTADDAIGLFASGLYNASATVSDASNGTFEASGSVSVGSAVKIYHPYSAGTTLSGEVLKTSVASEQSQSGVSNGSNMFAGGFSYATGSVEEGNVVNFALIHPLAYFKVDIASTEFASYKLVSLTLIDKSDSPKALSGSFAFDYSTGVLSPDKSGTFPWVRLAVSNVTLSNEKQSFWFSSFPADFAGSDVWLAVELYDSATATSVTIPVQFKNVNLKGGCINEIRLANLSLTDNDASLWYEPVEKRGFSGLGYAYGESNTFLIQCKKGTTIAGANYTPVDEYPDVVTISTKARGDFRKVVDPRGASFEFAKVGAVNDYGNGTGNTYTCAVYKYEVNNLGPTNYSITTSADKAEVSVTNKASIGGSPILLMVKNNKIIWSWTFWNITADGTKLQEVGKYKLANMDIGQATTDVTKWANSKRADGNPDVAYRTVNYYVWGRPMPIFYANDAKPCEYYGDYKNGSVPGVGGPLTLEESVAHPVGIIYNKKDKMGTPLARWMSDPVGDLWGCCSSNAEAVGTKTVFDPCPKGWRVPDQISFTDVINDASKVFDKTKAGRYGVSADGNFFLACGRYANNMQLASNETDYYWKAESTAVNGVVSYGIRWTNRLGGPTMQMPFMFQFKLDGSVYAIKQLNTGFAAPVRCQKDSDNR